MNTLTKQWLFLPLALLVSTAFYYFSTGLNEDPYTNIGFLLYLAPVPLLIYMLKADWLPAFAGAFTQGWLFLFASFYVYLGSGLPDIIVITVTIINMAKFATATLVTRFVLNRQQSWYSVLVFPASWVTFTFLQTVIMKGNITSTLAYTQFDYKMLIQIAALGGFHAVEYLPAIVASGLVLSIVYYKNLKVRIMSILIPILIIGASATYGAWYMHQPVPAQTLKVGLAVHDPKVFDPILETDTQAYSLQNAEAYVQRINYLAKQKAQYILQPEVSLILNLKNQAQILPLLKQASIQNRVTTFNPVALVARKVQRNALIVINPQGQIVAEYYKRRLVYGLEDSLTPGNNLAFLPNQKIKIGMAICHDMDYVTPSLLYAKENTQILFVPAVDFIVDGWWHARIAMLQAVAGGYSLARSALQGYISLSDSHGRVIGKQRSQKEQDVFLVGSLSAGDGHTFYGRYPYWFPTVNILLLLIFLIRSLRTKIANN